MSNRRFVGILACVMSTVSLLSGCSTPVEGTITATNESRTSTIFVAPVQASLPKREEIASFFETTSRVEAQNRVDVLSKGAGVCVQVGVEVGDVVKEGQVLVQLEKDELEAQTRQARVSVQQQKTAYEIAERSFNEGIGASVERDNMRFAYEQAKAALELSELKLRNQTIYAPIGGIVTQRIVQQGMVVSPGMPICTIVDPTSYILPINVPEKEISRLTIGQEAQARIDAFPDRVFTARVSRINPSIDPLSGTIRVILDFDESDKPLLRDAAFARVKLVMETRPNALLVPRSAVLEDESRKYVYVLEQVDESTINKEQFPGLNNRKLYMARRQEITTGLEQNDFVEAIQGLTEDTMIVTMGHHALKQDTYVVVTNIDEELAFRHTMSLEEALAAAKIKRDAVITTEVDVDIQL